MFGHAFFSILLRNAPGATGVRTSCLIHKQEFIFSEGEKMKNKANPTEVAATIAASAVANRLLNELPSIVQNAVDQSQKRLDQSNGVSETAVRSSHYRNELPYLIPDVDPSPMVESREWRAGKGKRVAMSWMVKEGTGLLLVEQHGNDCSMLLRTEPVEIRPMVKQVYNKFRVMLNTTMEQAVNALYTKGWKLNLSAIAQSAAWRKGKGKRQALSWMMKEGREDRILIEQYGYDCSILEKRDLNTAPNPGAKPGYSVFSVMEMTTVDEAIITLKNKGWSVKPPPFVVQMDLLQGGAS
jgi:hypothetical protein